MKGLKVLLQYTPQYIVQFTLLFPFSLFESQPKGPWDLCCDVSLEITCWMARANGEKVKDGCERIGKESISKILC